MRLMPRRVVRWWRSKGHGVHSPFAYRFITMVLRDKGRYYADKELNAMPDSRWHRLLFRLVCEFQPREVKVPRLSRSERRAIELADSRIAPESLKDTGVLTMRSPQCEIKVVRDINANANAWQEIMQGMTCGMTFSNGLTGISVTRPDLPRQHFEVKW